MPTPKNPALIALSAALLTAPAGAEVIAISNIELSGQQTVPAIPDAGHGLATVTIDTDTRSVTIEGTYTAMTSPVTAAHLHGPADPGVDSPIIIFPLTVTGGTEGTFSGGRVVALNQLATILDARSYINVHTQLHASGEIRGQVIVPAPSTLVLAACVLTPYARRKRRG